jgi:hypothetical protein
MKKAPAVKKPKSWARDEEHPELLVPLPAFDAEENPESTYTDKKFQKRKDDFVEEQKTKKKIALSKKEQARDEDEFDDDRGLEGDAEHSDDAAHPVVARNFANDAIRFDYATGKTQLTRELVPQWFADYNLFRPDDTVVLNGKRRTGKSFFMRAILYEMRHMFAGGLVFTATKHNGTARVAHQSPGVAGPGRPKGDLRKRAPFARLETGTQRAAPLLDATLALTRQTLTVFVTL